MVYDPTWGPLDPARREQIERALDVAGAGPVLLQDFINRVVQQLHIREFGLAAILSRRSGSGSAAFINRRTPGTTGAEWVADTDALTIEHGTYAQVSFPYQTLATRGRVTRKLQARGASYGDVLAEALTGKVDDYSDAWENGAMTGDSAAVTNQIDGLLTLVNNISAQVVAQTTVAAGDDLTLAKLDEAIDLVKGSAAKSDLAIVGSRTGLRKLNAALQSQQQFNDSVEIAAGFRVKTYDDIPMVVSTSMPDVLTFDGTKLTAFTGGATTALAVVNTRFVWVEELTPMTVLPLAKTDSQFDEFDIYSDWSLVLSNTFGASLLTGIKV